MAKKLHYFDVNGYGEHIRYLLHYGEIQFEDVRHCYQDWPKNKDKLSPYGQLPLYEDGDKEIHQSLAIMRYIGQSLNLGGGDPFKDAQLDSIALTIYDLFLKAKPIFEESDPAAREAIINTYQNETVNYFLSRFDKQIKENGGFLFGKLTWVDFILVGVVECIDTFLETNIEANYPNVQVLISKIHSYPGVKKYVATRKPYPNPLKK